MSINFGTFVMSLYVKKEKVSFRKARNYIKLIYLERQRGKIDGGLAYCATIKVLSSLVPYYYDEDVKTINVEVFAEIVSTIFVRKEKVSFPKAIYYIKYIYLEWEKKRVYTNVAYSMTLKILEALEDEYIDEVNTFE